MTAAQRRLYWAKWSLVQQCLVEFAGFTAEEAEEERRSMMLETLGATSSNAIRRDDQLDRVLDAFESAAVLLSGPTAGCRAVTQPVARLIYAIESLGLPDPYIDRLAADRFKVTPWRVLSASQLGALKLTATRCARIRKKKAP